MFILAEPSVNAKQTERDDPETGGQCFTRDKINTHCTEQREMHI